MKFFLLPLIGILATCAMAADPLEAYPEPEKGMSRHVLPLPQAENESNLQVELIVGKIVETDASNRYFFGGSLAQKSIEGWGYSYHILPELGPMAGTLMAVPPGTPKTKRFIQIGGEPYLVRYNSKLPIVVYVPEGTEVRFRIWRGDAEPKAIDEG